MSAAQILAELRERGIRVEPLPDGKIYLEPEERLDADLIERVRAAKPALLALLARPEPAAVRAAWTRDVTPDSRQPLIPPEVRAKVEAIEADARAKGWPPELLWNGGFWDCPRGLAAVLDPEDEIVEVGPEYIAILKLRRDLLRFRRHAA